MKNILKRLLHIKQGRGAVAKQLLRAKQLLGHPANALQGAFCLAKMRLAEDRSTKRFCVFCNRQVRAWVPYVIRTSDLSDFLIRAELTGSHLERFGCPHCSSTDRERHLRLYLDALGILKMFKGSYVLHIAPEPALTELIQSCDPSRYIKGDLYPSRPLINKLDLQQLPFPSEYLDFVICNHILEHVQDETSSVHEIYRVLKPGGRAICQTPFCAKLSHKFEDPNLQNLKDRLFFYGQDDHVRLFGSDISDVFISAGFVGQLRSHQEILPDINPVALGVNEKEPFFDFVRPI